MKTVKISLIASLPDNMTEAEMDRKLATLFRDIGGNLDNSEEYVPVENS